MFFSSVFIRISLFFCCTSSLSQPFEKGGTIKKRAKRHIYKDINHPGNLIRVDFLRWKYCDLDDDVKYKTKECNSINYHLVPEQLEPEKRELFYCDYRRWWAIFKYSKSPVIKKLNETVQNLVNVTNDEEKASLMARLDRELCRISEKKIVYKFPVSMNESDVESVIGALQIWGMKDEKLLNAARAVHGVWNRMYETKNTEWPRTF